MKKLCWRLGLLALVVFALQLTVVPRLQKRKDVQRFEQVVAEKPDVLFFCDSTHSWVDDADPDRRKLGDMLADELGLTVGVIDRGSYHLEVYEAFIDRMIARKVRQRTIVMPINLRSFSPEWHNRPAYQFAESKRELRQADDPLASALDPALRTLQLVADETISPDEFKRTPVYCGEQLVGHVRDFDNASYQKPTPQRTKNKFIYQYMYTLDRKHPKLVALHNICVKAKRHNLQVLFYVTPIDIATGEEHLPGQFRAQVARNLRLIAAQIGDLGPKLVDLSAILPPHEFSYRLYPNEHLKCGGRRAVAMRVGKELQESFGLRRGPDYSPPRSRTSPRLANEGANAGRH